MTFLSLDAELNIVVDLIVGARPNIMKIAPIYHELSKNQFFSVRLIHTGQHKSDEMSHVFFRLLGLPKPNYNFDLVAGSQSNQTADMMKFYDEVTEIEKPTCCIVVGDVNSSLACALVAAKKHIPIFHVEAGLRSHDRSMPEEINRLLIDSISEVYYTPSDDADLNLLKEGRAKESIVMVGNVMIDSFEFLKDKIQSKRAWEDQKLNKKSYAVVTFHRPSNVDNPESLLEIVHELNGISLKMPLVFPIHPRTEGKLRAFGLLEKLKSQQIRICGPLDYVNFMSLVMGSKFVITDSGGIQEETTYLGIPCLTLRENTERPITTTVGTNKLVNIHSLREAVDETLHDPIIDYRVPKFWDGKAAHRIVEHLKGYFFNTSGARRSI